MEVVALIDIEPGMVVAGRYVVSTVDRRWLAANPQAGAVCTALDAILDEPVLIHVADADGSTDVLEAARRVSILGDHRIAPTLDVGHSNGLDYVVSKRIAVTALDEILPKSPLPVDAACALIGEIGTVLVTAARRGLFHMFLRPNTVGITTKGTVLVSGIGIDAALALGTGVTAGEDYTPTKASRQDALDLIRLFYAAITGYWPAEEPFDGIPAAKRDNSRIARAKYLNPEVSNELDDFVSGILTGSDPGPGSVAEVLGFLNEWDAELLRFVNRAPVPDNDSVFNQSPRGFDEATSLPSPRSNSIGPSTSNTASEDQVKAALVRVGITRPGTRGLAAGVGGKTTGQYADRMQMREASSFPIGKAQLDNAAQDWDEWEPEQTYSQYSAYADHEYDNNLTSPIMDRDAQISDPDTQAIDIVSADNPGDDQAEETEDDNDTRVIMDDEDDGSWFLGGMFETNEQQREHQLREYERERRIAKAKEDEARRRIAALESASTSKRQEANAAVPPKQVRRLSPNSVDEAERDSPPSTAPVSAVSPDQESEDSSRGEAGTGAGRAAGIAGAVGAAATAAGAAGSGGSAGKKGATGKKGAAAGAGSANGAAAGSYGGAAAGSAAAGSSGGNGGGSDEGPSNTRKPFAWLVLALVVIAAIVISIAVFNFNSGDEEPQKTADTSAPAATDDGKDKKTKEPRADPPKIDTVTALDPDGDDEENDDKAEDVIPNTTGSWQTDRYNSAEFGNLKSGVGLLFELEDKTTVKEVRVKSSNSGGTFEIREGSDPDDAKKVGEGKFNSDGVTVKVDDDVDTDNLILWVTELPQDEDGFRAIINTVEFK